MAIVQFKYGSGALPSTKNSGALYLNQYNKKIYVDLDESNRICVGDFQRVNWTSSNTVTSPGNALKNLTIKDNNILYLTYDSTTGHSALWYYDDSNSPAQFREIISSESISIIASEFDKIDEELTSLDSELENLTNVVETKVSKEELEGYNFVTEEEAAAFAIAAISNVQGNATNDTAEILTIQGTRKYVDSKVQEVSSSIETLETKVNGIGGKINTLEGTVSGHTSQISSVSQTASGASNKADKALIAAQGAAATAADALTAANTAQQTADNKTTLQAVKDYISEGQYTTVPAVTTVISNAEKAIKEYADGKDQEINTRVSTLEQNIGNLSNIMNFLGVLAIDLNHEATTNPVTINGKSHTVVAGDVVIDNAGEEFVFDGSKWQQIGNITAETAAISDLQTRMETAEDEIDDLQTRMKTAEDEIDDLQDHMAEAESDLETINTTIGTKLTHSTDTLWGVLTWGTW